MQKGSLTASAFALGLSGTGRVTAQDGGTTGTRTASTEALIVNDEFRPGALFRVTSPALQQPPIPDGVAENEIGSRYDARRIEYLNTDEEVSFFPAQNAEVQQGEVYQFQSGFGLVATDGSGESVVSVEFESFPERITGDSNQLAPGSDLSVVEGGGKALVTVDNFYPGALLVITIGIVDYVPRENVRGSDILTEYDSRLAEYLNTGEDFLVYTAQAGEFEEGGVYVVRDEFDVTEPEGNLVTVELDRVAEADVDEEFF